MDDDEIQAVRALLKEARDAGIGIAFVPDEKGLEILHIVPDWPAVCDAQIDVGHLASAYDLETAVHASLRPLADLGEEYAAYLADRGSSRH